MDEYFRRKPGGKHKLRRLTYEKTYRYAADDGNGNDHAGWLRFERRTG